VTVITADLRSVGLMYLCSTMPAYAIRYVHGYGSLFPGWVDASFYASLFLTIILRGMGWSISASLLLVGHPSCWIDAEI